MKNDPVPDEYSRRILVELQRDARQSLQQLAAAVGLSVTPCWKRLKAMEESGVIRNYTIWVDRERVGLSNCVLAEVNLTRHSETVVDEFEAAVRECPAIVECYRTTGQADYLLKVLTPDVRAYDAFLHDVVFRLPGVTGIRSSIVLNEVKSGAPLPIGAAS
ncbi:Lrp/AsnC family transcriptional regulator [Cupriavidus sp. AU9028]|uniref:Lrp/AsnC family transcriptional regulator n=1 Tax=Cupriavidus sp. AU9028 TaxID=2871157 RepID=UPI001C93A6AA|nr:Lrp/AsnC family transcriptional regulator [Cupriavidus sp. AU9028]MBY4897413.1 Lrp/AsnC family transcriptional regulator [Cupriavidus sp. AU9028]